MKRLKKDHSAPEEKRFRTADRDLIEYDEVDEYPEDDERVFGIAAANRAEEQITDEEQKAYLRAETRSPRTENIQRRYEKTLAEKTRRICNVFICTALFLALFLCVVFYAHNYSYTTYSIDADIPASAGGNDHLFRLNGDVVLVSNDSIRYLSGADVKWTASGDFLNPIFTSSGSYFALSSHTGYQAYICDTAGVLSVVKVSRAIRSMDITSSGVLTVCTESEDTAYVSYFDRYGSRVSVELKTVLDVSGYPVSVCVSPDGQRLVAIYYTIANGIGENRIVCYDFENGLAANSYVVATYEDYYREDTFLCDSYFVDDSHCFVVGDNQLTVLSGFTGREVERETIPLDAPLQSVLFNGRTLTLILEQEGGCRVDTYNKRGKKEYSFDVDFSYDHVASTERYICFMQGESLRFYNLSGTFRYAGTMNFTATDMTFSAGKSLLFNTGTSLRLLTFH